MTASVKLTDEMAEAILVQVPVGFDRAVGWKAIHKVYGWDAESTFNNYIQLLYRQGRISRRKWQTHNNFMWLYWREAPRG